MGRAGGRSEEGGVDGAVWSAEKGKKKGKKNGGKKGENERVGYSDILYLVGFEFLQLGWVFCVETSMYVV